MKEECLDFRWKTLFQLIGEWRHVLIIWLFIVVMELLLN